MIKTESSEQQIEKIINWIELDIENRYPLIGTKLLEAAAELEVNVHLMFIANRRISFGIHKLVAKNAVTITEDTKPSTKKTQK